MTKAQKAENMKNVNHVKDYMKRFYGNRYERWNGAYKDDRQIYCNMYEMILEAADEMAKITSPVIWTGFNAKRKEFEAEMTKIEENFEFGSK